MPTDGLAPVDVSVVTVVKDDLPGLCRSWESIQAQRGVRLEWIVVDGDSGRETVHWLASVDDQRVRWVSEPDDGLYQAMNKGWRLSTGHLVTFLNAGDLLATDSTLSFVAHDQLRRSWAWAYGITVVTDELGDAVDIKHQIPFSLRETRWGRRAFPHPSTYVSRQLLSELGGFDERVGIAADQDLCLRAAQRARPAALPMVLATFDPNGVSSRQPVDAWVRQARMLRVRHGAPIARRRSIDRFVTAVLIAEARLRNAAARRMRRGPGQVRR